jgi:hypothetical protein
VFARQGVGLPRVVIDRVEQRDRTPRAACRPSRGGRAGPSASHATRGMVFFSFLSQYVSFVSHVLRKLYHFVWC